MTEKPEDRERRERLFREATDYHVAHALSLIGRTPYDEMVGRVDKRTRKGVTTYTFMGDPILEVTYEETVTPINPNDRYPLGPIYNKTLKFNHLKGEPPRPFKPSDGPFELSKRRVRRPLKEANKQDE